MDYRTALEIVRARHDMDLQYHKAFVELEDALKVALAADQAIAELGAAKVRLQAEVASQEARLEQVNRLLESANADERLARADAAYQQRLIEIDADTKAALERSAAARDKAVSETGRAVEAVRADLAKDLEGYKKEMAAKKASLAAEITERATERDAILRALFELKRLATR